VYDYVLATEPLTEAQMASIGWSGREGLSDTTNQFHYYRLTDDNRIVWGGYDAVYYLGSHRLSLDQRDDTHRGWRSTLPDLPARRPALHAPVGRRITMQPLPR
jgi:glycine/D-amino acid oxidase-like deaminating enzyme